MIVIEESMVGTQWSVRQNRGTLCLLRRGTRPAWALAFALWMHVAGGQEVRSVRGTVTDQDGHLLAGAVVLIQDRTTLRVRSYVTQEDGSYHFEDLFADLSYHLHANYAGVSSHSKILSKFDSDRGAVIDLTIHVRK